jgi:hypothetical protein
MGLSDTGYAIPVPSVLTGTPKLTILNPMDFGGSSRYQTRMLALRNFKVRAVIGDPSYSGVAETDTEYTNIIDPGYVSEAQDVEFKICTWDKKKPNFSCVATKSGGEYAYVDRIAYIALTTDAQSVTVNHGDGGEVSDGTLRAEEWMVLRLSKQYATPAKVFTMSHKGPMYIISPYTLFISDTLGCSLIVDKMEFHRESVAIYASILVEKDSQKGIVIGKNGEMLKKVGSAAREEIEHLLGKKVFLQLYVKVEKDWRNRMNALRELGYGNN